MFLLDDSFRVLDLVFLSLPSHVIYSDPCICFPNDPKAVNAEVTISVSLVTGLHILGVLVSSPLCSLRMGTSFMSPGDLTGVQATGTPVEEQNTRHSLVKGVSAAVHPPFPETPL